MVTGDEEEKELAVGLDTTIPTCMCLSKFTGLLRLMSLIIICGRSALPVAAQCFSSRKSHKVRSFCSACFQRISSRTEVGAVVRAEPGILSYVSNNLGIPLMRTELQALTVGTPYGIIEHR